MNSVEIKLLQHSTAIGQPCPNLVPNVTEDTILLDNGCPVGFYVRDISRYSPKAAKLADIADYELRSVRVPKSEMSRGPQGSKKDKLLRQQQGKELVTQFSVILGGVAPKPHMRRDYPTVSRVHSVASAKTFIKAMRLLCTEGEQIVKQVMPDQYEKQIQLIGENAPAKYRFGEMFTSSISNCNIAAAYHKDNANLQGCVNVIISKRKCSTGGNTTVPDYGLTFDSADNAMLVYPAWKNIHGVTPITATAAGGYRNTLVFYPLKAFRKYVE